MEPLTLTVKYTADELYRLHGLAQRRWSLIVRLLVNTVLIVPLLVVFFLDRSPLDARVRLYGAILIAVVLLNALNTAFERLRARREAAAVAEQLPEGRLTFHDDALEIVTAQGEQRLPWAAFKRVRHTSDGVILQTATGLTLIPRRVAPDDAAWARVTALVDAHIGAGP
jgi:hypothetical protein